MNLKVRKNVVKIAALLGVVIWVVDGVLDYLFFYEGSFFALTFTSIPSHELYIRLSWFGGLLIFSLFASWIIDDREEALSDKKELESLLRAVRNVNQLLVRENDRDSLLEGVCQNLIETRSYEHVWVALFDESKDPIAAAQEGLGEECEKLSECLEADQLPNCVDDSLAQSGVVTINDPSSSCGDCPISETYGAQSVINMRLEYDGKVYGMLSASIPSQLIENRQERELFEEVAGDIGFALHKLEVEENLRQSEEKFRSYVENAPIGVFLVDESGSYLEVNEAATELTGYPEEELLNMNVADLHPPEAEEGVRETFGELLEHESIRAELPYEQKNGSMGYFVINTVRISKDRYLGFTLDITERKEAERKLEEATLETLQALNRTIEASDEYTGEHIDRVQEISVEVGETLGLSEDRLEQLRYASILHDVGKIGVSDSILGKPDELTEEEWEEMEKHPEIGERIVGQVERLKRAAKIIGQHQEHYDGSGYPKGLKGNEITLEARIISVADAWDAMRTDRPYRDALPREDAVRELEENAGSQFDPEVVEVILEKLRK